MIDAGYILYNKKDMDNANTEEEKKLVPKFKFDRSIGSRGVDTTNTSHNMSRTELKTFGRVPYVYYAGNTDFVKFELTTVFHYDEVSKVTAREQVDEFKAIVDRREIVVVENSQGQEFLCDIHITSENSPRLYVKEDFDYIELAIECTEIG